MTDAELTRAYLAGESVDSLARRHGRTWATIASIVGHVWSRPPHIDEKGYPNGEENLQAPARVVGVD